MEGRLETKADILKTFIQEDRNEIRIILNRIQGITSSLVVSSFAITAFLFGKHEASIPKRPEYYSVLVDFLLIALITVVFFILKKNLVNARKALKLRQDLLNNLKEDDQNDLNLFPDPKGVIPDIHDTDLYWFVGLAISMIIAKIVIGLRIFGS
ncbi:MAG: hypothetical protein HY790_11450 [Deltaproteobacteria bacterium]|nr:hypothetical protein [Deltaproteobacteria bacterium]MBI4796428.1 hypothetical protein [Deltaproteobacteria bacterium]